MKKILLLFLLIPTFAFAAQQDIEQIGYEAGVTKNSDIRAGMNANFTKTQANFTELYTGKVDGTNEIFHDNDEPTSCDVGDLWVDDNGTSGERLYACESTNTWVKQGGSSGGGSWGSITGTITDQTDLIAMFDTKAGVADVLTKTNTTAFTPTADYHPATKKYVDDGGSFNPAIPGPIGGTTPSTGAFTTITADEVDVDKGDTYRGVGLKENTASTNIQSQMIHYTADNLLWRDEGGTDRDIFTSADVGTSSGNVAAGDHNHDAAYADIKADTNTIQWTFNATELGETATSPAGHMIFEVPVSVEWTLGELVCDGTTTSLQITVASATAPDGTFSTVHSSTLGTEGAITVTGWADPSAGTNVGAWVNTASTGDSTWCKLIFYLTN